MSQARILIAVLAIGAAVAAMPKPVFHGEGAAVPASKTEVTSLPGWDGPLPSKIFTGFIDAGTPPSGKGNMYFHYWMIQSEGNPATDPVVMWYNGGPGTMVSRSYHLRPP
jgi:hypothetical protein